MSLSRFIAALMILTLISGITACKKDSNPDPSSGGGDYYIQFTLDGTELKYVNNAEGNMNVVDAAGKYDFSGAALKTGNIAGAANLTLAIANVTAMKTNIAYVNYGTASSGTERAALAMVSYIDDAGTVFTSWGDEFKSSGITSDTKITFSEITETNLRGTFSGTTYKSISGTAPKHVITSGSFNLKRR